MGREAECEARVAGQPGHVKVLLESNELILRGGFRRRWALAELQAVQVTGDTLSLVAAEEPVELRLGAAVAAAWAKKIATPPPSLAAKLGVSIEARAFVIGAVTDAELASALEGHITTQSAAAALAVAQVHDITSLDAALVAHARLPNARHLWLVHPKGRDATLPDGVLRERMRAAGYADSKSCAVSERCTATRWAQR